VKKKAIDPSVVQVGLDVGYGVTKAVTLDGVQTVFPSVVGHAREIKFEAVSLAKKYPGDQLNDEDGSWFIGELAMSQTSVGGLLRLRGRTANEMAIGNAFRLRMTKAALGKLMPGRRNGEAVHIHIATGLPVDHMREANALKMALIGEHIVHTDQTHFVANISEVMVMPQPYGTIYANSLTPQGEINPRYTAKRTGVVDVGTYTIDLTLDDNGEYIDVESGTVENGIFSAQQRIESVFERDHHQKPRYSHVESILRNGYIRVQGDRCEYGEEVEKALEPVRSATIALISEKWQTSIEVDVIYLTGGGAVLVQDAIKEAGYRQAVLVENAQLANAIGYLRYALWAEKVQS
jgi:hypothetical protein